MMTADIFMVHLMGAGLLKPKNTRLGADIARAKAVISMEETGKSGEMIAFR